MSERKEASMRGWRFWVLALLAVSAGHGFGCGGGCQGVEPPPAEMPPSQTIEGGLQVRITEGGLSKLTAEIPGLVQAAVEDMTVPPQTIYDGTLGSLTLCPEGCPVNISIPPGGVTVEVTDADTLTVKVSLVAETSLQFMVDPLGFDPMYCSFDLSTDPNDPLRGEADIGFFIRQYDGELRIEVQGVHNVSVSGLEFGVSQCGILEDVLDFFAGGLSALLDWLDALIGNPIGEWIANELLLPWLQPYIDGLLPDPMGVEGMVDMGALISDLSPGTEGKLELRLTPGGYVNLLQHGISLGVITGLNSDVDPTTRGHVPDALGVMEHSEGARCVPPFATFDMEEFVTAGEMSHVVGRDTFALEVADELDGTNDQSSLVYESGPMAGEVADVGIGVSEHFLNLAGFHAVNSGALCVSMGTEQMDMLTVGLVGILIQSLSDLVDPNRGDAPMQVVVRPQWPAQFYVGEGTEENALVDLYLRDFRVDMYPFIEERYVRALTLALDMHIGLNLQTQVNAQGELVVVPTIIGVEEENVMVRVHNSELVAEDPAELEATLPQILGLIMPLLTSALGEGFPLPELGNGLTLGSLEFRPNTTNTMLLALASITPSNQPMPPMPVRTVAEVAEVQVPAPRDIRQGLIRKDPAMRPSVTLELSAEEPGPAGEYEWQYRVDSGLWHPYSPDRRVTIRDRAFMFQGWHVIEVRARRRGKPWTTDRTPVRIEALIDSVAPQLEVSRSEGAIRLDGFDLVTARSGLRYSLSTGPDRWTDYTTEDSVSLPLARALAAESGGKLGVRVKDEAGNVTERWTEPGAWVVAGPQTSGTDHQARGCNAAPGGSPTGMVFALVGLLGLLGLALLRSRMDAKRRGFASVASVLAVLVASAGLLACDNKSAGSNNNNDTLCGEDEECGHLACQDGQVPACNFGQCECVDDLPLGDVGTYSSLAIVPGPTAFVAAYNRSYGDLVVARYSPPGVVPNRPYSEGGDGWEFVDGVPPGPVRVPNSEIRGGVQAKGDNVGTHTAIGASSDHHPVVAYHDESKGSLKLAWFDGAEWQIHVVDDGGSEDPEEGNAGYYNAMIMRNGDRAPGIVYMAPLVSTGDASEPFTCQLRFAQADTENPSSPAEWTVYIIDEVTIQPPDGEGPIHDWVDGTGVTPSVALKEDGMPVVAYYDSLNGNLMMAEMIEDSEGGNRYFDDPIIVAGEDTNGNDTGDVGVFASIAVDLTTPNVYHYSFADAALENLYYYKTTMDEPEVVDDGYRLEENEQTGLPMPVFHYVGWDSELFITGGGFAMILYQDGTDHELRMATRMEEGGEWVFEVLGGDETPFAGAYGFYIDMAISGGTAYVSSYVINEHAEPDLLGNDPVKYFVEIFEKTLGPQ